MRSWSTYMVAHVATASNFWCITTEHWCHSTLNQNLHFFHDGPLFYLGLHFGFTLDLCPLDTTCSSSKPCLGSMDSMNGNHCFFLMIHFNLNPHHESHGNLVATFLERSVAAIKHMSLKLLNSSFECNSKGIWVISSPVIIVALASVTMSWICISASSASLAIYLGQAYCILPQIHAVGNTQYFNNATTTVFWSYFLEIMVC